MRISRNAITKLGVLALLTTSVVAQTDARAKLLQQFQSESWDVRASAFYGFLSMGLGRKFNGETSEMRSIVNKYLSAEPQESDPTKLALIQLLSRENTVVKTQRAEFDKSGKTMSEAYVNYYGDLIAAVACLDDERSLDALLGAITTGGLATEALARLGKRAIEPALRELQSHDPLVRSAALTVLSGIKRGSVNPIAPADSRLIESAVLKSLSDPDANVRITALRIAA